jgi:hypothetical protein
MITVEAVVAPGDRGGGTLVVAAAETYGRGASNGNPIEGKPTMRSLSGTTVVTIGTGAGKVIRKKLLPLAIATVLACATAATGLAAGSTVVTHSSFTTPRHPLCGVEGTAVVDITSVFRDTGNGTYFMGGTFVGVFTADNGRSTTLKGAGPMKQTSPAVIAGGTVTITTTYDGLFEKFSITGGPTLSVNAGSFAFVDVYVYTGDPNNPVADLSSPISETVSDLHGPHPDLQTGGCEVLGPYLQGP